VSIVGRLLCGLRADESRSPLAAKDLDAPATVVVSSTAFTDGDPIPRRHAGRGVGDNVSPELRWRGVPSGTVALVLLLDDIDVPLRKPLFHNAAVVAADLDGLAEGEFVAGTPGVRNVATADSGPRPAPVSLSRVGPRSRGSRSRDVDQGGARLSGRPRPGARHSDGDLRTMTVQAPQHIYS
jgi:Phosphatidylethanolamine-binding protein